MANTLDSENNQKKYSWNWMASVFTDVHFWVPLLVLVGGLLLLRYIR